MPAGAIGLSLCLMAMAAVAAGLAPLPAGRASVRPPSFDFSDWHFPVPAGDWLISRGPCGSGGLFQHQCGYYEDECAVDLIPVAGSMQSVPVLAPQAGTVFFLGTRFDTGLSVMLQHADGRISAMDHLSKVVVGLDQRVAQGQVLGYAGNTGDSGRAHVHFDVQYNAVERSCLSVAGIDEANLLRMTIVSHNLPWSALVLPDPPPNLPAWLPLVGVPADAPSALLPSKIVLSPSATASVPIAVASAFLGTQAVTFAGQPLTPTLETNDYTLFSLPLKAPSAIGDYQNNIEFWVGGPVTGSPPVTLSYSVRQPADTSAAAGLVAIYPQLVGPPDYSDQATTPQLCYSEPDSAGVAPLSYRVMITGPAQTDSGWISTTCWTPPELPAGLYYWKIFVRDALGHMSRTNDHPHVFRID